ncbi:MAG: hypothetical protein GF381_02755 [Candidatus Pacebacteria bacterium]|nr:hypothetical protein [Candidatus Paceibacterota bacterium]
MNEIVIKLEPISHYTIHLSEIKDGTFTHDDLEGESAKNKASQDCLNYLSELNPGRRWGYFFHQHQANRVIWTKDKLSPGKQFFLATADAAVTNASNFGLAMLVADCFPILLVDQRRQVFALIHAGWKPLLQNIIELTLLDLKLEFGVKPTGLTAWIGPGVRNCCYRFSDKPLQAELPSWQPTIQKQKSKWAIDLPLFIINELKRLGLNQKQILDYGQCTYCQDQTFFSHRRSLEKKDQKGRIVVGVSHP